MLFVYGVLLIAWAKATSGLRFTLADMCSCPFKIQPVCGIMEKAQITFMNLCALQCTQMQQNKKIFVLHKGTCCQLRQCSDFESPVCDQDGNVYTNRCKYEHQQCTVARLENRFLKINMSHPSCQCVQQCPSNYKPICDTEGKTHANLCAFANAKCIAEHTEGKSLQIDFMGKCCDALCDDTYATPPVCDSQNRTHPSLCSFLKHRCELKTKAEKWAHQVFLKSFGRCRT